MAKLYNMAQMTVSGTPGTGTFTLSAATVADGITYKTLAQAGAVNGDIVSYRANDGAGWEVGRGTVGGAGTTLTRGPLSSSNSNLAINAGPSTIVLISPLAEDFPPVPLTVPLGGTGATNFPVPSWPNAGGVYPIANGAGALTASAWGPYVGGFSNSIICYGAATDAAGAPWVEMGCSGGTLAARTATPLNQSLGGIWFRGYDGTIFPGNAGVSIEAYATQLWTGSARGTALRFSTTPNGGGVYAAAMTLDGNGALTLATPLAVANGGTGANNFPVNVIPTGNGGSLLFGHGTGAVTASPYWGLWTLPTNDAGLMAYGGPGNGSPYLEMGTCGNTMAAPTGTGINNNLAWFGGDGYNGSSWQYGGAFYIRATETWGATGRGCKYAVEVTANTTTAAAVRLNVEGNGACTNTTGTWAAISDVRLKRDIAPYERGLAAITRLNPVSFHFNGLALPDDGTIHYGLVADEVAEIVPEIVGEIDIAPEDHEPGKHGTVEHVPMLVKTVDPGRLIYALINSVKELSARIEALEAR
jgi:hypothetical protein